jgi:hypothetical protein
VFPLHGDEITLSPFYPSDVYKTGSAVRMILAGCTENARGCAGWVTIVNKEGTKGVAVKTVLNRCIQIP